MLVAEDSPADVLLIKEAFAEHELDCEFSLAKDGETAIRMVADLDRSASPCPDLMILDLNLPRRSGYEVLDAVRKSGRCSRIPVVVLTSSEAAADRARATALGCSRFLSKPPALNEFIQLGAVFRELLTGSAG